MKSHSLEMFKVCFTNMGCSDKATGAGRETTCLGSLLALLYVIL